MDNSVIEVCRAIGRDALRLTMLPVAAGAVLLFQTGSADAEDVGLIESYGAHCNDVYFGSDGGGLGGCLDFAALLSNDWYLALGAFQAGPESRSAAEFARDPLDDRGRLVLRVGKTFYGDRYNFTTTLRVGGEGGFVDDIAHDVRETLHEIVSTYTRTQRGQHDLRGIIGVSGHMWDDYELTSSTNLKTVFTPYAHASVGTDNMEGGGGMFLGFQSASAARPLPLMEPQSGAYAPFFGDDGLGFFVAGRGVAKDTLYGSLAEEAIGEAGIVGQYTVANTVRGTVLGSCTTKAYTGAQDPDCKATVRIGILY